ncbi:DUF7285 family protein [Halostella salina]|uniref:DUF7285 family protein n=1 Tax=Halostella salina TaxID=1547897 RepID=UPI000EF82B6B|nr:hypothetical protein [Halostella salina]
MSRWSTRRGQTEPIAALAAVLAVGAGLALYAGLVDTTLAGGSARDATPALRRVWRAVAETGVVSPADLAAGLDTAPDGHEVRITLSAAGETWTAGPAAPADAASASRTASVRVDPGTVCVGRLRVEVWA